ncbi:hypothetical protein J3A83DRAFT_4047770, partial [Scleroderma citrinum]
MSTTAQDPVGPANPISQADLEPNDEWKDRLRHQIQENLRPMFDEARKQMDDELARAPSTEAERVKTEGEAAIANIRKMAHEHYMSVLQRERQERRSAAGIFTEDMMKQQQAIWDNIEKEKKQKTAGQTSLPPSPQQTRQPQQPSPPPPPPSP